jgi:hypothetical protein
VSYTTIQCFQDWKCGKLDIPLEFNNLLMATITRSLSPFHIKQINMQPDWQLETFLKWIRSSFSGVRTPHPWHTLSQWWLSILRLWTRSSIAPHKQSYTSLGLASHFPDGLHLDQKTCVVWLFWIWVLNKVYYKYSTSWTIYSLETLLLTSSSLLFDHSNLSLGVDFIFWYDQVSWFHTSHSASWLQSRTSWITVRSRSRLLHQDEFLPVMNMIGIWWTSSATLDSTIVHNFLTSTQ